MTPEKQAELTRQFADHGLTVLLSKDFDSILIQLARLAQFERLMRQQAEENPWVMGGVAAVQAEQERFTPGVSRFRPALELIDIPAILAAVNRELQAQYDASARFDQNDLSAATAAFIGILCRR